MSDERKSVDLGNGWTLLCVRGRWTLDRLGMDWRHYLDDDEAGAIMSAIESRDQRIAALERELEEAREALEHWQGEWVATKARADLAEAGRDEALRKLEAVKRDIKDACAMCQAEGGELAERLFRAFGHTLATLAATSPSPCPRCSEPAGVLAQRIAKHLWNMGWRDPMMNKGESDIRFDIQCVLDAALTSADEVPTTQTQAEAYEARIKGLEAALRKCGRHTAGCPKAGGSACAEVRVDGVLMQCTCGLDAALASAEREPCTWTETEFGSYDTACGQLIEMGPEFDGQKCGCGRTIRVVPEERGEDEESEDDP